MRLISYLCVFLAGAVLMIIPAQFMAADMVQEGISSEQVWSIIQTWAPMQMAPAWYLGVAAFLLIIAAITGNAATANEKLYARIAKGDTEGDGI